MEFLQITGFNTKKKKKKSARNQEWKPKGCDNSYATILICKYRKQSNKSWSKEVQQVLLLMFDHQDLIWMVA